MTMTFARPALATRFARNNFVVRSETVFSEDQVRPAAPSSHRGW